MRASAFVPGHITGFFKPMEDQDPRRSGSIGCGVVISKGVYTNVGLRESDEGSIEIYLDGKKGDYPVSEYAAREVLRIAGGSYRVEVHHKSEIPISQGFGTSAAGALGTAMALNRALKLPLTLNKSGEIAHLAEIANRTGLGDVIAQCSGGLVLRLAPGAPGIGIVDRIPCDLSVVAWTVGPPIETKATLRDEERRRIMASQGWKSMDALLKHPDPENFMRVSKNFAQGSGLMSESVRSAVKVLDDENIPASMIMLGNSVFTLTRDPGELNDVLRHPMMVAEIDQMGGRTT
ncbi:MAG: pantoate kinase [Candidatus Hydrothermarchaeaceae archaeon]